MQRTAFNLTLFWSEDLGKFIAISLMPSDSSKFTLPTTCSFRPRICSYPNCTYYIRLKRPLSWREADVIRIWGNTTSIIRTSTLKLLHLKLAPFQGHRGRVISVVDLDAAYGSFVKEISSSPPFPHLFTKHRTLLGKSCILYC